MEQPDVEFGEEEEEQGISAEGDQDDSEIMRDSDPVPSQEEGVHDVSMDRIDEESNVGDSQSVANQAGGRKKVLKISFDEYRAISNILLMYMRREENRIENEALESTGLKRSKIVDWYLNDIIDDIDSEDDLLEKKTLVEKIIDRLVKVNLIVCAMLYESAL